MSDIADLGAPWAAPGLTAGESALVERLVQVMEANRARNKLLTDYYAGDVPLQNIGIAVPENNAFIMLKQVRVECDWPAIAVDRLADRSMFDGLMLPEGSGLEGEVRALSRRLTSLYRAALPTMLVHGCSFWTVGRAATGPVVHAHSAQTASALWDETNDRILAGLAIVGEGWNADYTHEAPDKLDLHTSGGVVELTRPDVESSDWVAQRFPNPLGRPLMEALCYRPDARWRFGHSRISRQVRRVCDAMMRENLRVEVAAELNVLPQKYIFGLTDDQYDALAADRFRNAVGALLMAAQPEDAETVPTAGQFPQVSLQPHIDLKRDLAAEFSGITGIPMSELGVVHDNPSSGEAIDAAEKPLVTLCSHMNEDMADRLENVARMALAVRLSTSLDGLPDDAWEVRAHFKDPAIPSLSATTDRAIKIASAAPVYPETEQFWADVGKDEAERHAMMGDIRRSRALAGATAILDRNRGLPDGDNRPGAGEVQGGA